MVDKSGEKQILTAPGANHSIGESDVNAQRRLLVRALVALIQLEIPLVAAAAAIRLARAAGARVLLDPTPAQQLPEELLRDLHVICPSAVGAEMLTGVRVVDSATARVAARNLVRRGAGAACVGAPGGNYLVSGEIELWLPHVPVRSVDRTGARDAFAAGLAVAISEGQPLDRAVRFGSFAAALKTTRLGVEAGFPSKHDVLAWLEDLDDEGRDHTATFARGRGRGRAQGQA
jgi:ribokinase